MKIVLDTNVIVSGLLSPFNPPGEIVRMTSAGILQLCYDARILSEYAAVLHRPKFSLNSDHVDAYLEQIKTRGVPSVSVPLQKSLPDQCDEAFLEVAIAAKAACLVTGNLKHYPVGSCQNVRVLSPADFLVFFRRRA